MTSEQLSPHSRGSNSFFGGATILTGVFLVLVAVTAVCVFWLPIRQLVFVWFSSPEFNYGPIVPPLAVLMVMRDLSRSRAAQGGGYWGLPFVVVGLALGVLSFLGPYIFPAQIGLVLFVIGTVVAFEGERRGLAAWPGLVYLFFAVPLAGALLAETSWQLQLISSKLGVGMLRLVQVPVFLEGNMIDLGQYKLQVAEACSGLRYIFPLASFGFLCAYLFRTRFWERALLFLTTVPIAIAMNGVRLAVTGIIVDRYGIDIAEGFMHAFEGWVVFCCCLALLMLEMKLLCLVDGGGRGLLQRMDLELTLPRFPGHGAPRLQPATAVVLAMTLLVGAIDLSLKSADAVIPDRQAFAEFPRQIGPWVGDEVPVDQDSLNMLNPTDHLSLDYRGSAGADANALVNVWIAYYGSQGNGTATHSPLLCIPGGGWAIERNEAVPVTIATTGGRRTMNINRLVISKDGDRQLVYYWFSERGRVETNEYLIKWHILVDSVTLNRTDGALVRFVAPIPAGHTEQATERQLQDFIGEVLPVLPAYIPERSTSAKQPTDM